MKLMGKREIGELEVGELISTLLISELCSIPIDNPEVPLMNAVIPVLLIVSLEIILSSVKNKSAKLKSIIDGKETFLIRDKKINQSALRENRISLEEFFSTIRQNGIGSLDEIEHCILEANGKISVIKNDSELSYIIISDGELMKKTVSELGLDENQISDALHGQAKESIFLMTYSKNGKFYIINKENKK
jgi:uncharacterized membrane protein YcaP (DUF421 family)